MGQTCHGHSVSCSDWTHTVTRDLMAVVSDGHLAGRQDDGECDHGVPRLTRLEVHPAPVQTRVTGSHCAHHQLGGVGGDDQPRATSEAPRLLLTPVFGRQSVRCPGVVGVYRLPVLVLVPEDRVQPLSGVLWLYLAAEVGGKPEYELNLLKR